MGQPDETRILIINAHWNNRGDESAIRSMIRSLKTAFGTSQMTITLPRDADMATAESLGCRLLGQYPEGYLEFIDSLLTLLTWGGCSFTKAGRRFLRAVDESDIVIHAPGGPSIGDIYGKLLTPSLSGYRYMYRLFQSKIVKGKPLFIYAASLGPFHSRLSNLIRRPLLARLNMITVRERKSSQYLKDQLGLESTVTADAALQMPVDDRFLQNAPGSEELARLISERKSVGITMVDFDWHPIHSRNKGLCGRTQSTMSDFITYLIGQEFHVVLIPQIFGWNDREYSLLSELTNGREASVTLLPRSFDAYVQHALISKMHCLVSMRYHPTIFAANAFVPFISVYYEHKMSGFVDSLGLQDWAVPIEELSYEILKSKFEALNRNYDEYVLKLRQRVPDFARKSHETTELIFNAYHHVD